VSPDTASAETVLEHLGMRRAFDALAIVGKLRDSVISDGVTAEHSVVYPALMNAKFSEALFELRAYFARGRITVTAFRLQNVAEPVFFVQWFADAEQQHTSSEYCHCHDRILSLMQHRERVEHSVWSAAGLVHVLEEYGVLDTLVELRRII
jgi:hypothetical protein